MVDEKLIIEKLELIKENSKKAMGNHLCMKHKQLEYFLNLLIEYINSIKTDNINEIYNCRKKILYPPKNFIAYNIVANENDKYKDSVQVDECIADEVEELWNKGVKTCGCCCGHGSSLGFIQVTDDCIEQMEELGYVHYIYDGLFGGAERKDAFVPKTYGHIYDGYSEGYLG